MLVRRQAGFAAVAGPFCRQHSNRARQVRELDTSVAAEKNTGIFSCADGRLVQRLAATGQQQQPHIQESLEWPQA